MTMAKSLTWLWTFLHTSSAWDSCSAKLRGLVFERPYDVLIGTPIAVEYSPAAHTLVVAGMRDKADEFVGLDIANWTSRWRQYDSMIVKVSSHNKLPGVRLADAKFGDGVMLAVADKWEKKASVISAFNPASGMQTWGPNLITYKKYHLGTPLVTYHESAGMVIVACGKYKHLSGKPTGASMVLGISIADGTEVWGPIELSFVKRALVSIPQEDIIRVGGTYTSSKKSDGCTLSLNPRDGSVSHSLVPLPVPVQVMVNVPVSGLVIAAGSDEGGAMVVALDPTTGSLRWKVIPRLAQSRVDAIIDVPVAGVVMVSGFNIVALDSATGDECWRSYTFRSCEQASTRYCTQMTYAPEDGSVLVTTARKKGQIWSLPVQKANGRQGTHFRGRKNWSFILARFGVGIGILVACAATPLICFCMLFRHRRRERQRSMLIAAEMRQIEMMTRDEAVN